MGNATARRRRDHFERAERRPLGNAYTIQLGLYDATTGARVPALGAPSGDFISLAPFQIVE